MHSLVRKTGMCLLTVVCLATGLYAQHIVRDNELDESIDQKVLGEELDVFTIIRNTVMQRMGGLEYIFSKYKKVDKNFYGQIMVKMLINGDGNVQYCKIVRSQLKNPDFTRDICNKIMEWRFGKLPVEKQELLLPFYFK